MHNKARRTSYRPDVSHLVRYRGRAIRVYVARIPMFWGEVEQKIIEMAAAQAYKNGWRKAVIHYIETPYAIFEDDRCMLAVLNLAMYHDPQGRYYRDDRYLCSMDSSGCLPVPPAKIAESDDHIDYGYSDFDFD